LAEPPEATRLDNCEPINLCLFSLGDFYLNWSSL